MFLLVKYIIRMWRRHKAAQQAGIQQAGS
jgi:hypothetical protein